MENKEKLLNESIISIRVKLQELNLKKTGKNKFQGFDYFELSDFLPSLNKLMLEEGINDIFNIDESYDKLTGESKGLFASLTLVKGSESQEYKMPFTLYETPLTKDGKPSMQDIQYLGALNTYYKRYLYLNAFGITDGEIIDGMDNSNLGKKEDKINYKTELEAYIIKYELNKAEICKEYKLNAKSTQEDFKKVLETLISKEN